MHNKEINDYFHGKIVVRAMKSTEDDPFIAKSYQGQRTRREGGAEINDSTKISHG